MPRELPGEIRTPLPPFSGGCRPFQPAAAQSKVKALTFRLYLFLFLFFQFVSSHSKKRQRSTVLRRLARFALLGAVLEGPTLAATPFIPSTFAPALALIIIAPSTQKSHLRRTNPASDFTTVRFPRLRTCDSRRTRSRDANWNCESHRIRPAAIPLPTYFLTDAPLQARSNNLT